MSKLLILYGTTDGQTAKIARFLGTELRTFGVQTDIVEAGTADPDPRDYTGVIVAASVHIGRYQQGVVRWTRAHAKALAGKPSAFLSVCLGVLQQDLKVQRDLVGIINRFEALTGWKPPRVKLVAGALKYTRYGWLKRMIMRRMSGKAGGSTDTSRDHEYTDWGDLREFAEAFWAMCRVIRRYESADDPAPVYATAG